jgi:hypothetical protein
MSGPENKAMSEAEQNAEGLKKLEALMRGEKTQDAMADQVGGDVGRKPRGRI